MAEVQLTGKHAGRRRNGAYCGKIGQATEKSFSPEVLAPAGKMRSGCPIQLISSFQPARSTCRQSSNVLIKKW